MDLEAQNQEVASLWALGILRRNRHRSRSVSLHHVRPFQFYSLTAVAPIDDASYERVVEDQKRLTAHAIIGALLRRGCPAHLAEFEESRTDGWQYVGLTGIRVDVDYSPYDSAAEVMTFTVVFDLGLIINPPEGQPAAPKSAGLR